MSERTQDTLANLTILQHKKGYRFGIDAVLLATDLAEIMGPRVAELGAGQGAVSLAIATQFPNAEILAIERQDGLFELLEENVSTNQFAAQITCIQADIRALRDTRKDLAQTMDLVVFNPPFFAPGSGRLSPSQERREAHQTLHGGIPEFLEVSRWLLKPRGRIKAVAPPSKLAEFFGVCAASDLGPETLRMVHARAHNDAYLAEVVLRRDFQGELVVKPALVVHENHEFSPEVQARLELKCQAQN